MIDIKWRNKFTENSKTAHCFTIGSDLRLDKQMWICQLQESTE